MRLPLLLLLATLLIGGCAGLRDTPGLQTQPDLLVDASWLQSHLADGDVVALHVGRDRTSYEAGHLPGARFLPLSAVAVNRGDQLNVLPPVDELKEAFEAVGVSDGSHVVLYGDLDGLAATRAFFALDVHGHRHVSVLDGGLAAWQRAGGSLSTATPTAARGSFSPRLQADLVPDAAAVNAVRLRPQTVLVDARPADQHTGADAAGLSRPGHIPPSASLYWKDDTRADGTLRPAAELRARYAAAGVVPGREVITYCRTGVQASHAYFVARYLGFTPLLYDGSFHDWSNNTDFPVATGE